MRVLTVEDVRALLHYDADTGEFTWVSGHKVGLPAGTSHGRGYLSIGVKGRRYLAHRLAWFYVHGRWPAAHIDHQNGDRSDNRLANLRECDNTENQQNRAKQRTNTSGATGVSWHRKMAKWQAKITVKGKRLWLGAFATIDEARSAYLEAKAKFHDFHPTLREGRDHG
ncbi:HNH endonuclease [Cupriavidus respiraculi]|uniref:HNH endonuclease n=1 Tax=Cupriavidus respiraculi TaxID=195930 RepID=UPI001C985E95|nr:HNH endonuclease [Cupriavidus respiraculi]MBY4947045.1 HNH endonuclease [Cupriavidus respiraculi]